MQYLIYPLRQYHINLLLDYLFYENKRAKLGKTWISCDKSISNTDFDGKQVNFGCLKQRKVIIFKLIFYMIWYQAIHIERTWKHIL